MTSEMPDYQPKPGDKVHVTFPATYCVTPPGTPRNAYRVELNGGLIGVMVDADAAIRVEPAPVEPPTAWGARIIATVRGVKRVRLSLVDPGDDNPWRVHPADVTRTHENWVSSEDLSDIVVLDPGEVSS